MEIHFKIEDFPTEKKSKAHLCCCVTLLATAAAAMGDLAGNPVALGLPLSTYSATTQAKSINNRETLGRYRKSRERETRADINNNPGDKNVCTTLLCCCIEEKMDAIVKTTEA